MIDCKIAGYLDCIVTAPPVVGENGACRFSEVDICVIEGVLKLFTATLDNGIIPLVVSQDQSEVLLKTDIPDNFTSARYTIVR